MATGEVNVPCMICGGPGYSHCSKGYIIGGECSECRRKREYIALHSGTTDDDHVKAMRIKYKSREQLDEKYSDIVAQETSEECMSL